MAKRMDFKQGVYKEAVKFFQDKLKVLPTKKWDDIKGAMHTRAFTVAGCMQEDILRDFRSAVNAAISKGESLQDFRDRFYTIANKWRASDPSFDEKMEKPKYGAWRSKVIYQTNMLTCAAAGQERQARSMPDVFTHAKYVCMMLPGSREEHKAWNGIVLPVNDPWWQKHSPPNGFGCQCEKEFISKYEMERGDEKETVRTKDKELSPNDTTNIGKNWDYSIGDADMGIAGLDSREKYEDIPQQGIWDAENDYKIPINKQLLPPQLQNEPISDVNVFAKALDSKLKDAFKGRTDVRFFNGGMVMQKNINGFTYPLIVDYKFLGGHIIKDNDIGRTKYLNYFVETLRNPTDVRFSFQEQPKRKTVSINVIFTGVFDEKNKKKKKLNKASTFVFRVYRHKLVSWTTYREDSDIKNAKMMGKKLL